jgi:hypothetical protein
VLLPALVWHVALVGHVPLQPRVSLLSIAVVILVVPLVLLVLVPKPPQVPKVLGPSRPAVHQMEVAVLYAALKLVPSPTLYLEECGMSEIVHACMCEQTVSSISIVVAQ